MKAQALLTQLAYSELASLSLSNEGSGVIEKSQLGKVLSFLNDGMLNLVPYFNGQIKEVMIEMHDHITNYHLVSRFASSQQPQEGVDYAYIKDSNRKPFKGDVAKITSVWDSYNRTRFINDEANYLSVFTQQ